MLPSKSDKVPTIDTHPQITILKCCQDGGNKSCALHFYFLFSLYINVLIFILLPSGFHH